MADEGVRGVKMKATVLCSAVACALAVSAGVRVSQGVGEVVRGEG